MQPPRMLPLLISVLAMPISLPMPVLAGPSTMVAIIMLVLAILSPEQLIMLAEAGVKASAENIAAVIKIFIENLPWNENQPFAGNRGTHPPPAMFPREVI